MTTADLQGASTSGDAVRGAAGWSCAACVRSALLCLVAFAFGVGAWFVLFGGPAKILAATDFGTEWFSDYRGAYWETARTVWAGKAEPHRAYIYPPFFAIVLGPLALLGREASSAAFTVLQPLLGVLLCVCAARLLNLRAGAAAAMAVLLALSFPVLHGVRWGHNSLLLAAGIVAGLLLAERGREWSAGAVLAAVIATKFFMAPLLLVLLLWRRGRAVAATALFTCVFLLPVPMGLLGASGTFEFYGKVREHIRADAPVVRHVANSQYAANVIERWTAGLRAPGELAGEGTRRALVAGGWIAMAAAVAGAWWGAGRRPRHATALALFVPWACLPLIVPTSWPHYFAWLALAQGYVAAQVWERWRREGALQAGSVVAAGFVVVAALLVSTPLFRAVGDWVKYAAWGIPLLANLATAVGLVVVIAGDRRDAEPVA